MKIRILILALIINLLSCSQTKNSQISNENVNSKPLEITRSDSPPILEIYQEAQGMWGVTGKTLFLRLYENGLIEGEFENSEKVVAGISKAEEVNTLKQTNITLNDVREFTELLGEENFQRVKGNYKRQCCCMDAVLNYKISFRFADKPQTVSLIGFCSLDEIVNPQKYKSSNFPREISTLMEKVWNFRSKMNLPNQEQ